MLRIGHRGAAAYAPENTLLSFAKALEIGVDFIETDIQASSDGVLLLHDKRVDRTMGGTGFVREMAWSELRGLRDRKAGQPIPRLEEALEAVRHRAQLMLELIDPSLTAPVIAAVRRVSSLDEVILASFHHRAVLAARSLAPSLRTLALIEAIPVSPTAFALEARCTHVGLSVDTVTAEFVSDLHAAGLEVFAYTANDPPSIAGLAALGVDGIISDRPDLIEVAS